MLFRFCKPATHVDTRRKVLRHRSFVKRNVDMSQSFRCGSHKFIAFKTTSRIHTAQICLHTCITTRNKSSSNSNELVHFVTLRHNNGMDLESSGCCELCDAMLVPVFFGNFMLRACESLICTCESFVWCLGAL